ncbi:hypothetical protein DFH28DRAFT_629389 [Melampsora americana]|nr:hypothetical protein DFH28DRAFT_629389 [Melampsora americana]
MFCFVYLLLLAIQFHENLTGLVENSFGRQGVTSPKYSLWQSRGIMDGLFPSTLSQESKTGDLDFSYYQNDPHITMKNINYEDLQENGQGSLQHDTENLQEKDGPSSFSYNPLMNHISHLNPSESYKQQEKADRSFKEIVNIALFENRHPNQQAHHDPQPTKLTRVSHSIPKVDGPLIPKDDHKADLSSISVATKTQKSSKSWIDTENSIGKQHDPYFEGGVKERKLGKINKNEINEKTDNPQHISAGNLQKKKETSEKGNMGEMFSTILDGSHVDTSRELNSQARDTHKHRKPWLQVVAPKSNTRSTVRETLIKDVSNRKGKILIPKEGKLQEPKVHSQVLDNQNSFKALENFKESLNLNVVKVNMPLKDNNKQFQCVSDNIPYNKEVTKLNKKKEPSPMVDPVQRNDDQRILRDSTEYSTHSKEDLIPEETFTIHEGNAGGSDLDEEEVTPQVTTDNNQMKRKGDQRRSKSAKSKKSKKGNKSKKSKNKSMGKQTSILSFDAEFLDSTGPHLSKKNVALTREDLFKSDQLQFLKYSLKFNDKTLYLPILLSDLEVEYLIHFEFWNYKAWEDNMMNFVETFGPWREGVRRIDCLQAQFKEKHMVWNWNQNKDKLPKVAQAYLKSLRADEEFSTFRDTNLDDWKIYIDRAKSLQKHGPDLIEKVSAILGDQEDKRIVTLNLMSRYDSDFLRNVFDSGAVKEGIDLPILITFDQALRLSYATGLKDVLDKDDIEYKASELIEAMNGRVSGFGGEEYISSDFSWISEHTRSYLTKPGSRIAELVEERIKALAKRADFLKVKVPDFLDPYIPDSARGLTLGEILLSTHAGLDLESLVKMKKLLNIGEGQGAKTHIKPLDKTQTQIIGAWGSIKKELKVDAVNIKKYCDLRHEIIIDLQAHIRSHDLESLL